MALPDYTTQDAATYKANIDEEVANSKCTLGTEVTPSGNTFEIAIPADCRRVTLSLASVGITAADTIRMRIGYNSTSFIADVGGGYFYSTDAPAYSVSDHQNAYVALGVMSSSSDDIDGQVIFTRYLVDTNEYRWTFSGNLFVESSTTQSFMAVAGNTFSSSQIDRFEFSTIGTATFNAGLVNIVYEK